ncbi:MULTISPECIES: T9SS type A sorting domain-containing protein [unclassified Carboxylicivirga]|uniref:T9SS type A sorting domain-containing protein n=1 Tax=Carboxylicivirga TaxID=1628153 RepID=UPI003D34A277
MMRKIAAFGYIAILVLLLFTSGLQAQTAIAPASGDGSQSNPYLITSLENLYWISQNEDTWNKYFLQTANIDASPSHSWHPYDHDNDPGTADVPMGFPPIGYFNFSSVAFMGHYDGGGFTISNVYMHNPDAYALGLFGNTREASITRLGLNDLIIIGGNYVGGIIGTANKTDISYCYASGELKGYDCGLLTGELNYSNITNCYARGNIAEGRSDGLLASGSQSQITNCYSVVSSSTNNSPQLSGSVYYNIINSFYNTDVAGDNLTFITARSTYDLQQSCTYLEAGWDFMHETINNSKGIWGMNPLVNDGYPFLWWQGFESTANLDDCCFYPELSIQGDGTVENPYQVENACHLKWISQNPGVWDKHFIQMCSINLSKSQTWNYGDHDNNNKTPLLPLGYRPIGEYIKNSNGTITANGFSGVYDGQGFTIDSVYIYRPEESNIGFFGLIKSGHVKNLGLTNGRVVGGSSTAIFAANIAEASVENCFSEGNVTGGTAYDGFVGGFVGYAKWNASIYNCYANCNVYSDFSDIGGFAGCFGGSELSHCYALGSVQGESIVGGFVGFLSTTIKNSYARTTIKAASASSIGGFVGWGHTDGLTEHCYSASTIECPEGANVGGFIGSRTEFSMRNCLFDNTIADYSKVGDGIAYSSEMMKNMCTFTSKAWDFAGESENGTLDHWKINPEFNNGYPFLLWQDGMHTGSCNPSWVNPVNPELSIDVYPNPAASVINVKGYQTPFTYVIIDMNGRVQQEGSGIKDIPIHNLSNGTYTLVVSDSNNSRSTIFIKKH